MNPIPYSPSIEHIEDDEAEIAQELMETMLSISKTTYADSGHATRSVHLKSHGILHGEMRVVDGLPAWLAQGIFARPATYPVVMRFSTTPGDMLPDSVSTPRGLAIKIIGVPGERLPGSEGAATQDLVMVNGPAFQNDNAKGFLRSLKLLAPTTDKLEGVKKAMSAALRGVEAAIEAVGGSSATIRSMGGEPPNHPLGETYYTQVPLLHGAYMGKISVAPTSLGLTALTGQKLDITDDPMALRAAVVDHFRRDGGTWEVRVQLCTDLDAMPIEKASVEWPEDQSPYITVARITVPAQNAWDGTFTETLNDRLSFNPWHGVAAHRPIGSVMRVRKLAYDKSAAFRTQRTGQPRAEPTSLADLGIGQAK